MDKESDKKNSASRSHNHKGGKVFYVDKDGSIKSTPNNNVNAAESAKRAELAGVDE